MTVEWVRIGSVAKMVRTPVEILPEESYRRVGLYSWAKGFLHRPPVAGDEMGSLRYFSFPAGSLVLSNIQAWEGAIGVAGDSEEGFVASNRFLPYVPSVRLDVRYWFHFLASEQGMDILRKSSPGTTMRNRTLRRDLFEASRIPLPDLETQRAITSRLDRIARVVRTVPIERGITRFGAALVADSLRGWPARPLGEGLRRRDDAEAVVASGSYPMVGVRGSGRGAFASEVISGEATKYRFLNKVHAGDLIYPKLGGWTGAFAIVPRELGGRWASPEFVMYEIDGNVLDAQFLEGLVSSDAFAQRVARLSVGTNMNRRRLSPNALEALLVSLPPLKEQRRIGRRLAALREATLLAARQRSLLDSLLPAARNEEFRKLLAS